MSKSEGSAQVHFLRKGFPLTRDSKSVGFEEVRQAVSDAPLNEIMPQCPGDHAAALGFALGWAMMAARDGMVFWAAPEADFFEDGLPNAEGLAQFGVDLDRLLMVRAQSQMDALWAAEEALSIPQSITLCTVSYNRKPLNLLTTRRLLLAAERHKTRCILLRLDKAGTSAAWSRWQISSGSSQGEGRELGAQPGRTRQSQLQSHLGHSQPCFPQPRVPARCGDGWRCGCRACRQTG
jgi:hypothetical protein